MRLLNQVLLNAGNAAGNLTTIAGLLAHVFAFSIQVVITGTAAGTLTLQGSNDPVPDANFPSTPVWTPTNWTEIANSSEPVSGAGTVMYDFNQTPGFNWVRVVFTSSSGTGTMTIRLNTKGF